MRLQARPFQRRINAAVAPSQVPTAQALVAETSATELRIA